MFLKGISEYNRQGQEVKTGMVIGRAARDAEHYTTSTGKDVTSVSIKAYGKQDGTAEFLNVKCWGTLSGIAETIRKGDPFLAAGRIEIREYNGKLYKDLAADFVLPLSVPVSAASPAQNLSSLQSRMENAGFAEISEEDGELPF